MKDCPACGLPLDEHETMDPGPWEGAVGVVYLCAAARKVHISTTEGWSDVTTIIEPC